MALRRPRLRDRRVASALLFLAVILTAITAAPILLERRSFHLSEQMLHETQPLHEATQRVRVAMLQLQTSERGYLLTGSNHYLTEYQSAQRELRSALDDIDESVPNDGSLLDQRVKTVRAAAESWRTQFAEPRMAKVTRAHPRAQELSSDGELAFAGFRKSVDDLGLGIQSELDHQDDHRHRLLRWLDVSVLALGLGGLFGLALLTYVVAASLRLQSEANEAHELNRQKDEFLSLVGHEIRTPVTVIRLISESIRRHQRQEHALDPWTADRLHTMERQAHRISWLVDQLLDVGSVPGGIELSRKPIDAVGLTLRALHRVQEVAPSFPLHFNASQPEALAEIDEQRMEQVLTHLIGNAVKFSPTPRAVRVHLNVTPTEVQWTIADQGVGIPRRDQKRLFQRFYRASNAPATGAAGIGLGLHLSQVIASAHGGRIWFESTPHRGSTFHIALPRRVAVTEQPVTPAPTHTLPASATTH